MKRRTKDSVGIWSYTECPKMRFFSKELYGTHTNTTISYVSAQQNQMSKSQHISYNSSPRILRNV